jgi:hypothetical protein
VAAVGVSKYAVRCWAPTETGGAMAVLLSVAWVELAMAVPSP